MQRLFEPPSITVRNRLFFSLFIFHSTQKISLQLLTQWNYLFHGIKKIILSHQQYLFFKYNFFGEYYLYKNRAKTSSSQNSPNIWAFFAQLNDYIYKKSECTLLNFFAFLIFSVAQKPIGSSLLISQKLDLRSKTIKIGRGKKWSSSPITLTGLSNPKLNLFLWLA